MSTPSPAPEQVLQRLDWHIVKRLDGLLQGEYRSLFKGTGIDLAGLREYQPGDDVRAIDWNVTARTTIPYIREYTEDREITAWFLVDLSPSLDYGTGPAAREKRAVLIDFVGTLARILTRRGNRVGAVIYGRGVQGTLPARSGRLAVLRLIDRLRHEPRLPEAPETHLGDLLDNALRTIRRRSLVVIVSDFISAPGWERSLFLLNQRHEVLAVRVVDPREESLPDAGIIVLEDAETGEQLEVDTGDPQFRERFSGAARERRSTVDAALRRSGVEAVTLSTDEDLVRSIVRMAMQRKQRRAVA